MSQEAMEVVLDHIHARRRRDRDAVAATLDPAVVHQGVRPELICRNRDEVLTVVEYSMQGVQSGIDRLEILDAGPDQAILGVAGPRFRQVKEASPAGEVFILMTVRDGHITSMRDFRSRDDALAAAHAKPTAG
jgi:hypothetical protein